MSFCCFSKRLLLLLLLNCFGEEVCLLDGVVFDAVLLVVSILIGVDFAVLQLLLDDLVIMNLYLFDLSLL